MTTIDTHQYLKDDLSTLSRYFTFSFSFFVFFIIISLQTIMHKEASRLKFTLYIEYSEFLLCNVLDVVSEIYIGGSFLEECFYSYSQEIIYAVAK